MSIDPLEPVPVEDSDRPSMARVGLAPPTVQGQFQVRQQQPRWPMVLGVIAVVFGVGGMLTYAWGIISMLWMKQLFQSMAGGVHIPQIPEDLVAINVTSSALNIAAAVMLLFAGIGLLKRRRSGVTLTRIWAGIKMLFGIAAAVLAYFTQEKMWTLMTQQNPNMPQFGPSKQIMVAVSVFFALAWAWALPVFMLIFLARRRIREQIATWP